MNVCLVVYIEINIARRIDNKEIIECNCKILCISIFVLFCLFVNFFFFFFFVILIYSSSYLFYIFYNLYFLLTPLKIILEPPLRAPPPFLGLETTVNKIYNTRHIQKQN